MWTNRWEGAATQWWKLPVWYGERAENDFHSITSIAEDEESAILGGRSVKRIVVFEVSIKDAVEEHIFGDVSDRKLLYFWCTQIQGVFLLKASKALSIATLK